eukprot:12416029-Karenia_brevis.AAC.1
MGTWIELVHSGRMHQPFFEAEGRAAATRRVSWEHGSSWCILPECTSHFLRQRAERRRPSGVMGTWVELVHSTGVHQPVFEAEGRAATTPGVSWEHGLS